MGRRIPLRRLQLRLRPLLPQTRRRSCTLPLLQEGRFLFPQGWIQEGRFPQGWIQEGWLLLSQRWIQEGWIWVPQGWIQEGWIWVPQGWIQEGRVQEGRVQVQEGGGQGGGQEEGSAGRRGRAEADHKGCLQKVRQGRNRVPRQEHGSHRHRSCVRQGRVPPLLPERV